MNIKNYIYKIISKILRINEFLSNPLNYRNIENPFYVTKAKTYVWVEEEDKY